MFLSGIQSEFHLDSRLKHAGVTDFGRNSLRGIDPQRLKALESSDRQTHPC
jgi:hypothetical protein